MQSKYIAIGVVAAVVIAAGAYAFSKNASYQPPASSQNQASTDQGNAPVTGNTPAAGTGTTATLTAKSFTVNGNDTSADLTSITVAKGTPVIITFGADAQGTYHGGLDFRSSVVSTGPIASGSTKTVAFTAEQSFSFQPYWPTTNIAKPYTVNVTVR